MKHVFDDELFCSLKNELSEVSAQIDAQSAKLMGLIDQKKEYPLNWFGKRSRRYLLAYLGDPKRFIAIILRAIDQKRLTFNGTANSEQTIRYLATVIDVISPKTGKVLKVETLVSYAKKIHAGEIEGCKEEEFDWLG